ncbi:MAG: rhombosortase [Candidatus Didemnitutus sp.]|nr:rhombosortase [Candidatus Didemnitutus sp.]
MGTAKLISRFGFPPWYFLAVCLAVLVVQLNPAWREALIYDRAALGGGEYWRAWTGHLVHFGWPHFVADAGLLLILGWTLGRRFPGASVTALIVQPLFISAVLYWLDPGMERYAGLSAVNLGLLLLLAVRGWQGDRSDWFWPAVIVIYVAELVFEITQGGQGGGFIRFDEPTVKVATSAHLAATAYALLAWLFIRARQHRSTPGAKSAS